MSDADARRSDGIEADIRGGLAAFEFEPFFQPIVNLDNAHLIGFEALARWRHPERGLVSPADFVAFAESNGLIRAIDSVILDRAWRTFEDVLTSYPLRGPPLLLSVNLSAEHLLDSAIVDRIEALMAAGRGIISRLQFEITETLLISNTEMAERILSRLKLLGVTIALDDFGTGYSSLVYLHQFPIDCIKIDRSFSKEILTSPRSRAIVRSIIALARSMELRVVAEGVEEREIVDDLRLLGCEFGQGNYFGKPVPASGLVDIIKASPRG